MPLGSVTVDLDELVGSDDFDIRDAIVDSTVNKLSRDIGSELRDVLKDRIVRMVESQIDSKIEEVFQKAMVPTDYMGNPRPGGKASTLAELVLKEAESYLAQKVDDRGNSGHNSYSEKRLTRAQFLIQSAAAEFIKNELQPEIKKAQEQFRAEMGSQLAVAFKKTLESCIRG